MKLVVMSILIALLSISLLQAGTIKGLIKDADTGDPLMGANIVLGKTMMGTITDDDGFFILQDVPLGKWQLTASYLGYIDVTQTVIVSKVDVDLEIEMQPTVFKGQEVIVEVHRAEDRKTPVTFTEIDDTELMERYTTQDVPELLKTTPGVFVSSAGLGEAEIFIRGFDAEHIQVLINGIPTNDPESQVVYWSNWTGLSGNASSIQIQRGVGASLMGSGSFGGSVNIVTMKYPATRQMVLRGAGVGFYTQGGMYDTRRIADGTAGAQTYTPFNQLWSIDYSTGLLYDGKLNIRVAYERKAGDYYIPGTYYNGHSIFIGAQSILGNHLLTFNFIGAPQRHNQARTMQDQELFSTLGREYNRFNHPYQENYYFKPQFDLHWDWAISEKAFLKTNAFVTLGTGGGRYLRNDNFDVNTGEVGFKPVTESNNAKYFGRHARFIYETTGEVLVGYNPTTQQYTYNGVTDDVSRASNLISSSFAHSWRNDSQNDHKQFGLNAAYQHQINKYFTFILGGEARNWRAAHHAQSFDFRQWDPATDGPMTIQEVQKRYDYDGIVTNLSGFGRILLNPMPDLTIMVDGQYANYSSRVEENPIRVWDFGIMSFTPYTYLATKDQKDSNGNPLYADEDYERTFTFFMPKVGLNYNFSPELNAFLSYGVSKKEPKVGDWYSRNEGPGANQLPGQELKEETITNIELGVGYARRYYAIKANIYLLDFDDKVASVLNQQGDYVTNNIGKAEHRGFELVANGRIKQFDGMISGTYSQNRWKEMSVQEIFGVPAEDVVDKVVPFSPEQMAHIEAGYNWGPVRLGLGFTYWDEYYGNYDNTAKLPAFAELGAVISYAFRWGGSNVDLRWNLNNILSRENLIRADWASDYNRNDALGGQYYMYVLQGPLFNSSIVAQITL